MILCPRPSLKQQTDCSKHSTTMYPTFTSYEYISNIHSLIHTVPFVRIWGPLWPHSMFGYTNMKGILKTTFHGTHKVVDQILFNVTQTLPFILQQKQPLPFTTKETSTELTTYMRSEESTNTSCHKKRRLQL